MMEILLYLLTLIVGIAVGFVIAHPGPLWPLKIGATKISGKSAKTEGDGFLFDPTAVASIPDEDWMRLKGNPDAIRRYIDQRAHSSAELTALRQGVIAARKDSLRYFSEGDEFMGNASKRDAKALERQADQLQASLEA
jgi:hypothetical protein